VGSDEGFLLGDIQVRKGFISMKILKIKWQRLVHGGRTCPRCGETEKEVEKAFQSLKQSLAPLGIDVVLEKKELDPETFAKDVLQSNRIWIGERPLEKLLDARVGQSLCCGPCGDTECMTVEVGKEIYETIPSEVIIKAGLVAASEMLTKEPAEPSSVCCPGPDSDSKGCK
jgi:hypothetical protein